MTQHSTAFPSYTACICRKNIESSFPPFAYWPKGTKDETEREDSYIYVRDEASKNC
jgi:hypothetical protein